MAGTLRSFDAEALFSQLSVAADAIHERWQILASEGLDLRRPTDGERCVTPVDRYADEVLYGLLSRATPRIPVISEESTHGTINDASEYWLVDPIDGSHNLALGLPFFAISVALIRNGAPILGWVSDPCRGVTYKAALKRGATVSFRRGRDTKLQCSSTRTLACSTVGVIGARRSPEHFTKLAAECRRIRTVSCSALELCFVASGAYDAFIDLSAEGYEKDCDFAAAMLILQESGGRISCRDGRDLRLATPDLHCSRQQPIVAAGDTALLADLIKNFH